MLFRSDCSAATSDTPDNDGDGVSVCLDCDDGDAARFPGNPEVCDDKDNDCNNKKDDGLTFGTNAERGVCVHFREKVRGPFVRRHSALTVTVADCDGLVAALTST